MKVCKYCKGTGKQINKQAKHRRANYKSGKNKAVSWYLGKDYENTQAPCSKCIGTGRVLR